MQAPFGMHFSPFRLRGWHAYFVPIDYLSMSAAPRAA